MDVTADQNAHTVPSEAARNKVVNHGSAHPIPRIALALALMTTAANCFLKYLWWAACYSAWSGIPKFAEQWKSAGAKASFYGWSVIVLEFAALVLLYTAIRLRQLNSAAVRTGLRLAASLTITIVGSGFLALALSWVKQSH
jgi:hypothetical protein